MKLSFLPIFIRCLFLRVFLQLFLTKLLCHMNIIFHFLSFFPPHLVCLLFSLCEPKSGGAIQCSLSMFTALALRPGSLIRNRVQVSDEKEGKKREKKKNCLLLILQGYFVVGKVVQLSFVQPPEADMWPVQCIGEQNILHLVWILSLLYETLDLFVPDGLSHSAITASLIKPTATDFVT